MKGISIIGMMGGEEAEESAPNQMGRLSESFCRSNRDSRLPSTPEATMAANKSFGEGNLQSGLTSRIPMGEDLRVHGLRGEEDLPRFTMWGETELPDYSGT